MLALSWWVLEGTHSLWFLIHFWVKLTVMFGGRGVSLWPMLFGTYKIMQGFRINHAISNHNLDLRLVLHLHLHILCTHDGIIHNVILLDLNPLIPFRQSPVQLMPPKPQLHCQIQQQTTSQIDPKPSPLRIKTIITFRHLHESQISSPLNYLVLCSSM